MLEFSPVCNATRKICPSKVALIKIAHDCEIIDQTLRTGILANPDVAAENRNKFLIAENILISAELACGVDVDNEECMVLEGLIQLLEINHMPI